MVIRHIMCHHGCLSDSSWLFCWFVILRPVLPTCLRPPAIYEKIHLREFDFWEKCLHLMLVQALLLMLRWAFGCRYLGFLNVRILPKNLISRKWFFIIILLKARDESISSGGNVSTNQPSGSAVIPTVATPSGTNGAGPMLSVSPYDFGAIFGFS